ncbi:MAG: DNA-directed RNA polymerase subunit N [archaeon]|nr:DNA-directed RNA polymerase subunit N [archaeon]
MIIPVRCFSCGKVVSEQYEEFNNRTQKGEKAAKVLDELGVKRYCCRRMIFSQVDLMKDLLQYE